MNIKHTSHRFFNRAAFLAVQIIRLLAVSANTSSENSKIDNAVKGGVMNYRRDELDDGTDPGGWYG
ncbi:MAG: hypothetical protein WD795_08380 [Woeseia sp.]